MSYVFKYNSHSYRFRSNPYPSIEDAKQAAIEWADGDNITERMISFHELNDRGLAGPMLDCGMRFKQPARYCWADDPLSYRNLP